MFRQATLACLIACTLAASVSANRNLQQARSRNQFVWNFRLIQPITGLLNPGKQCFVLFECTTTGRGGNLQADLQNTHAQIRHKALMLASEGIGNCSWLMYKIASRGDLIFGTSQCAQP